MSINLNYLLLLLISQLIGIKAFSQIEEGSEDARLESYYTHPEKYMERAYQPVDELAIEALEDVGQAINKDKALNYDFSKVLMNPATGSRLGFIGKNYQRLYMHFSNVKQDNKDPNLYHVLGKSRVKDNICSFKGTFYIKEVGVVSNMGEIYPDKRKKMGYTLVEYHLYEDKDQKHAGVFEGVTYYGWYIDAKGKMIYGGLEPSANSGAIGVWRSYDNKHIKIKRANWGDADIPLCYGLRTGDCCFYISDTYLKNGWEDYEFGINGTHNKSSKEIEAARKREETKWWE